MTLRETKSWRPSIGWAACVECWSRIWVWLPSSDRTPCSWNILNILVHQARVSWGPKHLLIHHSLACFSTSKRKNQVSHRPLVKCLIVFCGHLKPQVESIKKARFASVTCFWFCLHMGCQTSGCYIWKHIENRIKYKTKLLSWIYFA